MADETVQETQEKKLDPVNINIPGWQERDKLKTEARLELRSEYEMLLKLWKEDELDKVRKDSEKIATEGIQKLFDKWKEDQKPPTDAEIQQLLNQEYIEFTLPVNISSNGQQQVKTFTIRELPQEAEIKFYNLFLSKVNSKISSLQAFTQEGMDKPFEEKVKAYLGLFQEFPDMMADAVVIILNPFGEDKEVTRQWVQKHIGSNRQWNIVDAQIKVNRLKDFFSRLFQSGQSTQTMLGGLNFQQLQQLAR